MTRSSAACSSSSRLFSPSRSEIREHLYDGRSNAASNVIDVYISYLRSKLEGPGHPKILHTKRGQGYLLGPEE